MTNELTLWRDWMRAQGLSDRTIMERMATVRLLLAHATAAPTTLTPAHIIAFMARRMQPATRATYHATVRAFCAWMQRTGIRPDNPADQTPRPRRPKSLPRPITAAQLDAVIEAANRRRTRTYVLLAAYAGLRIHEIAKVHGRHFDPYTHALTVLGKGGKVGQVPLHDVLIDEAHHYPADEYWFPAYESQTSADHVSAHAVGQAIGDAMARAGVRGTPHQLRHFYGTELVDRGVHLRVVQELMRHATPASTAIYTEVKTRQMREGIDLLPMPSRMLAA